MVARGAGTIITIGSWTASTRTPFAGLHSASKAAAEQLTRSWAAEFGHHGIRVAGIAPGVTRIRVRALSVNGRDHMVVRGPFDRIPARGLTELGASGVVDPAEVKDRTGGVHKLVDTVGSRTLNQSLAALARGGEVALVSLFSQEPQPLDPMGLFTFLEQHRIHPVLNRVVGKVVIQVP